MIAAECREVGRDVSSAVGRLIQQKASHVIDQSSLGRHAAGSRIEGSLRRVEVEQAARVDGLRLQQVVAQAAIVHAPLDGVVAHRLGPAIDHTDVGFRAVPRQAGRVADQRVAESAVELDAGQTAGPRIDIDARNADVFGSGGAVIGLESVVVIMRHAHTELADQGGREDTVVVDAHTVGLLNAGALERALRETAG